MVFKPATFKPKQPAPAVVDSTQPDESGIEVISSTAQPVVSLTVEDAVARVIAQYQQELRESHIATEVVTQWLIQEVAKQQQLGSTDIADLGANAAQNINRYSDDMLSHVKGRDLESMGESLKEVIGIAKGIDIQSLIGKEGFVSKIFSSLRATKEKVLAQFNSVSTQLDRVVQQVETQQARLKERVEQLDIVFEHNVDEYKALTKAILFGETHKALLLSQLETMSSDSALVSQQRNDLSSLIERINKRVHDLKTLQMTAIQTAPMIRMVQSNNLTLIEKFNNIKMLTIPAWKKQFTLAISLIEQKKSVELANKIDDATNDLIKRNADLLRQNTINTAKANQRSTIDIETLEHVQTTLITTLEDVISIEQEGARARADANEKMVAMKQELTNILR